MGNTLRDRGIVTVSNLDEFEDAVEAFACGGSRRELMERLFALGMTAPAIRWLAEFPGRTMLVAGSHAKATDAVS